jgi:dihydroorotate dehydrogenase electron transfer subunit
MTKAIVRHALEAGVACHASIEERMGCGIGVCRGCAVAVVSGGRKKFVRACTDGPVLSGEELAEWAGHEGSRAREGNHTGKEASDVG